MNSAVTQMLRHSANPGMHHGMATTACFEIATFAAQQPQRTQMNILNPTFALITVVSLSIASPAAFADNKNTTNVHTPDRSVKTIHISSDAQSAHPKNNNEADASITRLLMEMESPAEDMLDEAEAGNTAKLNNLYKELQALMIKLDRNNMDRRKADMQSKNIALLDAWFDLITVEMKEMDDMPALLNAINQFTGQLIISTNFKYDLKRNIAWMDYLGRYLLLANKHPGISIGKYRIDTQRKDLLVTWGYVRRYIRKDKSGMALANHIDLVMTNLLREDNTKKLIARLNEILNLVDDIEVYFNIE
jgi:hypothetical protein